MYMPWRPWTLSAHTASTRARAPSSVDRAKIRSTILAKKVCGAFNSETQNPGFTMVKQTKGDLSLAMWADNFWPKRWSKSLVSWSEVGTISQVIKFIDNQGLRPSIKNNLWDSWLVQSKIVSESKIVKFWVFLEDSPSPNPYYLGDNSGCLW
jgi:hypothetical protein